VHYEHSGGDLLEAQAVLNHAHAHTTEGYVRDRSGVCRDRLRPR
jgi:hypothetical protein